MLPQERFLLKTKNLDLFCLLQEQEISISATNSSWLRYRRIAEKTNQKLMDSIPKKLFFFLIFIVPMSMLVLLQVTISSPDYDYYLKPLIRSSIRWILTINIAFIVVLCVYNLYIFSNFKSKNPLKILITVIVNIMSWIFDCLKSQKLKNLPKLIMNIISYILVIIASYGIFFLFLFEIMKGFQFLGAEFPSFVSALNSEYILKLINKLVPSNQYVSGYLGTISFIVISNIATQYISVTIKKFLIIYNYKWKLAQHSLASTLVLMYLIVGVICFRPSADLHEHVVGLGFMIMGLVFHFQKILSIEYEIDKELYLRSLILKLIGLHYELDKHN